MTKLLEEAVAQVRALPEDEQDRRSSGALIFHARSPARDRQDYTFSMEQIEGIRHAKRKRWPRASFASEKRLRKIFGAQDRLRRPWPPEDRT